jgi:hypothetical protein
MNVLTVAVAFLGLSVAAASAQAYYHGQSVPLEVLQRNLVRQRAGLPPITLHGAEDRGSARPVDSRGRSYENGTGTSPYNPARPTFTGVRF